MKSRKKNAEYINAYDIARVQQALKKESSKKQNNFNPKDSALVKFLIWENGNR